MALLAWEDRYSVGVKTLDDQHTVLFGILNDLYDAMKKGQAQTVTGPLLRKLAEYTGRHFATEEAMMSSAKFAGLAAHRAKHKELIKQVEAYITRFERGDVMLSVDLFNFLRDWLTTHISKEDKDYGPALVAHGAH
ncbi:MAG: bacteriohemerythrin [Terracidiphilus sp.]|jgi:hemerythrin-like metal-binding protein